MTNQSLTLASLNETIARAEARYLATMPTDAKGSPLTSSADLKKARKFLDDAVVASFATLCEESKLDAGDVCEAIATKMPMKAVMRLCEFAHALSAQNYRKLDATTVLTVLSCALAGAKTRDAVSFAVTGKGDDSTSDEVKDIARVRRLQALFPKVGASTEPTQVSRSFGDRGFCGFIGIGRFERDAHGMRTLKINRSNAFYKSIKGLVDKASDSTLSEMKGADKGAE